MVEKTGPISYRIRDQLTSLVTKAHTEHLRVVSIEEWKIPTTERALRKIELVAPVDPSDSDSESGEEKAEFSMRKCRNRRENSDDKSDIPLMERHIVDAKVGMEGVTSGPSTHKDNCPERGPSDSTNAVGVSGGSSGIEVSDDI